MDWIDGQNPIGAPDPPDAGGKRRGGGRGRSRYARFSGAVLVLGLLVPASGRETSPRPSEYEVKAAFLYNFAKFVQWPAEAFPKPQSPLVISIVGEDPFGETLDRMVQGKTLGQRPFVIKRVKWGAAMRDCHILFVSSSESKRIGKLGDLLEKASVLTVGEVPGFARHGGVINFFLRERKVRFEINVGAARRSHLMISSQLLRLATIVQ